MPGSADNHCAANAGGAGKHSGAAGIDEGPVFRDFCRGNKTLRPGSLSMRDIQYLLGRYPIAVNGDLVTVKPHDLRRTYARRLYEAGMAPVEI